MADLPFTIEIDRARQLVVIAFAPLFWTTDVAERFAADCFAKVAQLGTGPGEHMILVDLRDAVLQSQDVYARMQALIGRATAARIALVASAPLARMQTKRLQIRDNIVLFADYAEAEQWLTGAERRAA